MTSHVHISEESTPVLWYIITTWGIPVSTSDCHTYTSDSDCWQHSISYIEDAIKAGKNLYSFQDENDTDDINFWIASSEEELFSKWKKLDAKLFVPLALDEENDFDDDEDDA